PSRSHKKGGWSFQWNLITDTLSLKTLGKVFVQLSGISQWYTESLPHWQPIPKEPGERAQWEQRTTVARLDHTTSLSIWVARRSHEHRVSNATLTFRVHGHTVVWEDVSVDFAHALSEQFPVRPTRTAGTGPQFSFADAWAKDWFGWFNSTRAAPHEPA